MNEDDHRTLLLSEGLKNAKRPFYV